MTDERLEQILEQALAPKIDADEITIQRKAGNYKMKKKIIAAGLAACAALALVVTGFGSGGFGTQKEGTGIAGEQKTGSGNLFAITAYAAELPKGVSEGEVLGLNLTSAAYATPEYLAGRFSISGENIEKVKITTDKCNLYSVAALDPEAAEQKKAEADSKHGEYVVLADTFDCEPGDTTQPASCRYEQIVIAGSQYEGAYDPAISFGMSVPEKLQSSHQDLKQAFCEDTDQVNGATLTMEVTFTDGSTQVHHYQVKTGNIYVPADEAGNLQWDQLTRFLGAGENTKNTPYTYGYLLEKID